MTSIDDKLDRFLAEEKAAIEAIRGLASPIDRLHAYAERLSSKPWSGDLTRVLSLEMAAMLTEIERRLAKLERR